MAARPWATARTSRSRCSSVCSSYMPLGLRKPSCPEVLARKLADLIEKENKWIVHIYPSVNHAVFKSLPKKFCIKIIQVRFDFSSWEHFEDFISKKAKIKNNILYSKQDESEFWKLHNFWIQKDNNNHYIYLTSKFNYKKSLHKKYHQTKFSL